MLEARLLPPTGIHDQQNACYVATVDLAVPLPLRCQVKSMWECFNVVES